VSSRKLQRSDDIREYVRTEYLEKRRLGELVAGILVHSKSKVSLWLAGKYKGDTDRLEREIAVYLKSRQMTRRDETVLLRIKELLLDADNPDAIVSRLAADAHEHQRRTAHP
jgi:hypothetical protein